MNHFLNCALLLVANIFFHSSAVHIDRRTRRVASGRSPQYRTHNSGLPFAGRVAVLIRGEVFRGEHGPCDNKSDFVWANQVNATKSLVYQILDPLQNDLQNEVHVVITDSSECYLTAHLRQTIGIDRVLGMHEFASITQGESVQKAISALEESVASRQLAVEGYDLILMVRHDSLFPQATISWWNVNMSKIAVANDCPKEVKEDPFFGWQCLDDQVFAIPGSLWKPFRDVVFSDNGCFDKCGPGVPSIDNQTCHTEGHWCLPPLQQALQPMGSDVGLLGFWLSSYPLSPTSAREEIKAELRDHKLQALINDLPSEPGCYFLLPTGCPAKNVTFEMPVWMKESYLRSLVSDDSLKMIDLFAGCGAQKKRYQNLCGVVDIKMHMIEV